MNYKLLFTQYMDEKGIKYTELDDFTVKVSYAASNLPGVASYVCFDKDGEGMITLYSYAIAKFPEDKLLPGLVAVNDLNKKYRWVKFYIDDKYEVVCQADAYIDEATGGEECSNMVSRMVSIVDKAYPTIMSAIYSNQ